MTTRQRSAREELRAFEEGQIEPAVFPHREHVRFAYQMLALYPISETAARFARGLAHLARKAGKPQLYHETVTIAFLAVIAERRATTPHTCWDEFISTNPDF